MSDTKEVARRIVKDAMRGADDGDPILTELNPLDEKFFRNARVNVQIPVIDPVQTRRALVWLINAIPGLIAEMDRARDRRTKSLIAVAKLRAWSHMFGRWVKK